MDQRITETALIELERQYWEAIKKKDPEGAMRLSDDPCIVTGAQGVGRIRRQDLGQMLAKARYVLHDFKLTDTQVLFPSEDVAIIAYKVHEELSLEGKRFPLDAADASTWVRREGRWVCALHTESILGDPYGQDRKPPRDNEPSAA